LPIKDSTIGLLITKCKENDRQDQRRLFSLLHEYGLKICYRYTSIEDDPTALLYEGFVRLFKNVGQPEFAETNSQYELEKQFKFVLIDTCIESGRKKEERDLFDWNYNIKNEGYQPTPKEIIDSLRMLCFPYRIVFNLSVIDGFSYQDISSKLLIPVEGVEHHLARAREQLNKLFQPMFAIKAI
jgi:DNA-directed RNA polymerase specialized sigma24 family protein